MRSPAHALTRVTSCSCVHRASEWTDGGDRGLCSRHGACDTRASDGWMGGRESVFVFALGYARAFDARGGVSRGVVPSGWCCLMRCIRLVRGRIPLGAVLLSVRRSVILYAILPIVPSTG